MFYSTANAGYAIYAAISLLTVRDQIPNASLCVLSSGLSEYDKKILNKNKIEFCELDLSEKFTRSWDYPIDCYYIFAGPELFLKKGYSKSVYIDGDILCTSNPLKGLPAVRSIAGVVSTSVNDDYSAIFGNDWRQIKKIWNLNQDIANRRRINAGVVYFNNEKMKEIGLLSKTGHLFKESLKKGVPRKGDDSLFSLFQYVHLAEKEIVYLPPQYNFVLQFNEWCYPVDSLVFFHFSLDKPWKKRPYKHKNQKHNMFNPYTRIWRKKLKRIAPRVWISGLLMMIRTSD